MQIHLHLVDLTCTFFALDQYMQESQVSNELSSYTWPWYEMHVMYIWSPSPHIRCGHYSLEIIVASENCFKLLIGACANVH